MKNKFQYYKIFILFFIFSFINLFSRVFQTPLYYNNNGYPLFTTKYIENIAKSYNFQYDPIYQIDFVAAGFYRIASNSFNKRYQLKKLATLINGDDIFDVSDLFYDSQTPILFGSTNLINNPLKKNEWVYIDGTIKPNYYIVHNGFILGIDLSYRNSEEYALTFRSRLPIKNIVINNYNGWRNLKSSNEEINTIDDLIPETEFSNSMAQKTISGFYKNGIEKSWEYAKIDGIGDLNFELDYIKSLCDERIIWYLISGIILPTGLNSKNENNYLSLHTGNNGHYGLRLGTQFLFEFNKQISFIAYGSYEFAFPSSEWIISSFRDAFIHGLQPDYIEAKISWGSAILSLDMITRLRDYCGMTFGYQLFYKGKDSICSNQKFIKDATGKINEIDFSVLQERSIRIANKLRGSLFVDALDNFQIEIGGDFIFYGSNIMQENEFFCRASYSY